MKGTAFDSEILATYFCSLRVCYLYEWLILFFYLFFSIINVQIKSYQPTSLFLSEFLSSHMFVSSEFIIMLNTDSFLNGNVAVQKCSLIVPTQTTQMLLHLRCVITLHSKSHQKDTLLDQEVPIIMKSCNAFIISKQLFHIFTES